MNAPVEKVCIAIPVYKSFDALSIAEAQSIKQCVTVLHKYPFIFFGPLHFDYQPYLNFAKDNQVAAKPLKFVNEYFYSLAGYNKLLLSVRFYRAFKVFKYILIYQPDGWVFKDELEYWCDKSFDYIGAPWFEGFGKPVDNPKIIGVGNGGLSLRKTDSYLKILTSFAYISPPREIWKTVTRNSPWHYIPVSLLRYFLNLTIRNNSFHWFNTFEGQEDSFWGLSVPRSFPWFKVANVESAISFSFEACPERLYDMNKRKLPFACHAWEKNNPGFWKRFIHV